MATGSQTWQGVLLPKKCMYCERRFSKAEHLKRHQRSHTGERPYKCTQCSKRFARSDVLGRHQKSHTQPVNGEAVEDSSVSDHENVVSPEQSESVFEQSGPLIVQNEVRNQLQSTHQNTSPPTDPALQDTVTRYTDQVSTQQPQRSLDHLAMMATPQNWIGRDIDVSMTNGQEMPNVMSLDPIGDWNRGRSGRADSIQNTVYGGNFPFSADADYPDMHAFPNNSSYFGLDSIPNAIASNSAHYSHSVPNLDGITQPIGSMIPNDIQTWFDQFDGDIQVQANPFAAYGNEATTRSEVANQSPPVYSRPSLIRSESLRLLEESVPNERFAKVKQCWPTRGSTATRWMPSLWRDLCLKPEDNLFNEPGSPIESIAQRQRDGFRWGLDKEARDRLMKIFGNLPQSESRNDPIGNQETTASLNSQPAEAASRNSRLDGAARSNVADFPPAEIFDMGLDLYFRHFHQSFPFVHLPTFNPKSANVPMLFTMCLIGLTTINTKGALTFVRQAFSIAFKVVEAEINSRTLMSKPRAEQMGTLASALLVLILAEIIGEKADHENCHRLYVDLVTKAHEQRLFAAGDGEPLDQSTFEEFLDADARWRAWSRVESTKRLIICILLCDSGLAALYHSCPVMRTDSIELILPCATALFQARPASKWLELLSKGHPISMPTIALYPQHAMIPKVTGSLDFLGMHGILCTIRLRISEDYHRLLSGTEHKDAQRWFVPWQTFITDTRAKITLDLVVEVMGSYGNMLSTMNPQCMVVWHNMCIMLTADPRIFELGAGSEGAVAARQALEDIAIWSQTNAARRAILHAAQTFKFMSNRRASDGDPFQSINCLFISALVLGLYVFMVPPDNKDGDDSLSFELMDDVDWCRVGNEGLVNENEYIDDPAVNFIRNGGSMSLSGVVHEGGYHSARRILLDFANLLEDIGKWRVCRYIQVLRIMSDALVDVEAVVE